MAFKSSLSQLLVSRVRHFSSYRKSVETEVDDRTGIATVTMNRPPVNSFSLEFLTELSSVFTELKNNNSRGMIITSFSDKVFSSGLDLAELCKPDPDRLKQLWIRVQDVLINLYGTPYRTAAVINGHVVAGGCMLGMACEYRVMVNNFMIGLNQVQVGIPVPPWLTLVMQNTVGKRQAELSLTSAHLYNTSEALKIGLIDENAADKADAVDKAKAFFRRFEKTNPVAEARTKQFARGPDLEAIQKMRTADVEFYTSFVMQPDVQATLQRYIDQLKKK